MQFKILPQIARERHLRRELECLFSLASRMKSLQVLNCREGAIKGFCHALLAYQKRGCTTICLGLGFMVSEIDMANPKFSRINVIGTSGSGKSTFARRVARRLGHPYVEMDLLFWLPDWQEPSDEVFLPKVAAALDAPRWVLDGNYQRTAPIKWRNVTAIVWLDYSFARVFFQALTRAMARVIHRRELWPGTGNRESFRRTFLSRKSILVWTWQTHAKMRERYDALFRAPEHAHIHRVRLKSPAEAEKFLASLPLP
jgi:adenylate kinase family enzyme